MNHVILELRVLNQILVITPWKLIGYLGVAIFAARWFVQVIASHRAGRPRIPRAFWHMSLIGSLMLLSYFIFSEKNDSVGVLANIFPAFVAIYNLSFRSLPRNETKGSPKTCVCGLNRRHAGDTPSKTEEADEPEVLRGV